MSDKTIVYPMQATPGAVVYHPPDNLDTNTWFLEKLRQRAETAEARVNELEAENAQLRDQFTSSLAANGQFRSDVCYAAFGHRDALTDEQIVDSMKQLRARLERAEAILFELGTGYWVAILDDNDLPVEPKMGQRVIQYWKESK